MEKRVFGIILTLLGIGGLIFAGVSITNKSSTFTYIAVYGVLGLIFFLTGISLLRNTNDKAS